MKHVGDHKNYNTLAIKAFFKTVDRDVTPDPDLKGRNKSRPDTVQTTPLFDLNPPSNDIFNEFVPDTTRLPTSNTVIQQPRDSITQR
jgi:hypothetical protein